MQFGRSLAIASLFGAAALGAACDKHDPLSPTLSSQASQLAKASNTDTNTTTNPGTPAPGTPGDSATHVDSTGHHTPPPVTPPHPDTGRSAPPPDSAASAYHGTVVISGRAVALRRAIEGSAMGGDSILYQPVAGTTVTVSANVGGAVAGTATTDASGAFSVSVPAGVYRITGHPPAGDGVVDGSVTVIAGQPAIFVQLILPPKP